MAPADIRITAEPIDTGRCKFVVSEPVHGGGVRRFASPDDASGSPLAEAIFAIPGADVAEVIVSGNLVTVVKRGPAPWRSEEHTSELQSQSNLVCRLLLEKKKKVHSLNRTQSSKHHDTLCQV